MLPRITTAALCGLLCATACAVTPPAARAPSMRADRPLLFADEFDGAALDRAKWEVIGPTFWVNNEQQVYLDDPQTLQLMPAGAVDGAQGGVLALQPRFRTGVRTPDGGVADFVSGRIESKGKFEFTHGRA
jgi:hypothetical protein